MNHGAAQLGWPGCSGPDGDFGWSLVTGTGVSALVSGSLGLGRAPCALLGRTALGPAAQGPCQPSRDPAPRQARPGPGTRVRAHCPLPTQMLTPSSPTAGSGHFPRCASDTPKPWGRGQKKVRGCPQARRARTVAVMERLSPQGPGESRGQGEELGWCVLDARGTGAGPDRDLGQRKGLGQAPCWELPGSGSAQPGLPTGLSGSTSSPLQAGGPSDGDVYG